MVDKWKDDRAGITIRFWDWFRKSFHRDPSTLTKKEATRIMYSSLRSHKHEREIKRFIDFSGNEKGLWSRKVGMYSQLKNRDVITPEMKRSAEPLHVRMYERHGRAVAMHRRARGIVWTKPQVDFIKANINYSPKKLLAGLRELKPDATYTYSSVATMKSRIRRGGKHEA